MSDLSERATQANEDFNASAADDLDPQTRLYFDRIKPGSIVHYYPGLIIQNYPKPTERRPGLVMAVWRDAAGHAEILEIAKITSNTSKKFAHDLLTDVPAFSIEFNFAIPTRIQCGDLRFLPCKPDIVQTSFLLPPVVQVKTLWPDLLVRRACSIIWDKSCRLEGTLPHALLTREGFAFGNIGLMHVASNLWQPDMLNNGNRHAGHSANVQSVIDSVARFANIHLKKKIGTGGRWDYPHHDQWPSPVPETTFFIHEKNRKPAGMTNDLT